MAAVSKRGNALRYASGLLQNDKEVVMAAVSACASAYKYASGLLQNDKEVAITAISHKYNDVYYDTNDWRVPSILTNDKEVVMAAASNGFCPRLEKLSWTMKKDKEVVMAAVSIHGNYLSIADYSMLDDKEIVMTAVSSYGYALQYAGSLNDDKEVVMAAVSNHGSALQYASDSLKEDLEVVLTALKTDPCAITYAKKLVPNDTIYLAAKFGVLWDGTFSTYSNDEGCLRHLVEQYPDQVSKFDDETGLCPFMLVASRKQNDNDGVSSHHQNLATLFNMMKICPELVKFYDFCDETNNEDVHEDVHVVAKKQKTSHVNSNVVK